MKCSNCGSENRDSVRFCEECRNPMYTAQLETRDGNTCLGCGHMNRSGVRFCEECGVNLVVPVEAKPEPADKVICPKCKHSNSARYRFCEECGAKLAVPVEAKPKPVEKTICPRCRHSNPAGYRFCEECGVPLILRSSPQPQKVSSQSGKNSFVTSRLLGGAFLIGLFAVAIFIFGPRSINPPPANYQESQPVFEPIQQVSAETPLVPSPPSNNEQPNITEPTTEELSQPDDSSSSVIEVPEQKDMTIPEPESTNPLLETEMPAMGGGVFTDIDEDGLHDGFEDWLANAFFPILLFHKDEDVPQHEIMRFYQVTPIYKTSPNNWNYPLYQFSEFQGPPGILITYVVAYTWDTGDSTFGIKAHAGDAEAMRIFLVNPRNDPFTWNPIVVIIKRHEDKPEAYYSYELQWDQTHPVIWVSEDKHAMYSTWEECDDYTNNWTHYEFEWCGSNGYQISYPIVSGVDGFNVGEREEHPFSRIPDNTLGLFPNEFVWSSRSESWFPLYDNQGNVIGEYDAAENFCGGYASAECGGGMDGKWWPMSNTGNQYDLARLLSGYANKQFRAFYGAEYEVCIHTGDVNYGGTDFDVDVTIEGTAHSQTFYDLDNRYNTFERGSIDCFEVGTHALEEKLTGLSLYVYNDPDSDSEWYLEFVSVKDLFTGEFWNFPCYCWIDDSDEYDSDIRQPTLGPYIYLQPGQ